MQTLTIEQITTYIKACATKNLLSEHGDDKELYIRREMSTAVGITEGYAALVGRAPLRRASGAARQLYQEVQDRFIPSEGLTRAELLDRRDRLSDLLAEAAHSGELIYIIHQMAEKVAKENADYINLQGAFSRHG